MNNNKKATKRALLTSVIALVMCVVMLVGTTFAWFTDTASTGVNKITAGNLHVAIQNETGESIENLEWVAKDGRAQDEILWEPGATYTLTPFKIANTGNLALKYKMVVTGLDGDADLLRVIKFTYKMGETVLDLNAEGHLAAGAATGMITVSATMDKNAGNEYMKKTLEGVEIKVYATQDTVENDSFGNTYDKDATYPVVVSQSQLNTTLTLNDLKDESGKVSPVEVTLGDTTAEDIDYKQNNSGYTGKGVMLGSTKLNKYAAAPASEGQYKFTFKDGTINSAATGYGLIDNYTDTSVYMLVPGNSDVVFENMTFNGVVSFDIQKYTSPWSNLNSITFKNCTFSGIIIGTCPASNVTFDGCTFNAYTNTTSANNSNPIWWREDTEGSGANANPIKTFTFVNNEVIGTRPVKIERIGKTVSPIFTIKNNTFDISAQDGDGTVKKNMAINIGMGENPNLPFTLIDEGNTISANTAALYTASLTGGSNWYVEKSGMKVLDGNGNEKVITAMVWKTTTGETFELKSVD